MDDNTPNEGLTVMDLDKLVHLLQTAEKTWDIAKDKDIVLLLGKTGAGKTTTAAFLLGHTFSYKEVERVKTTKSGKEIKTKVRELVATNPLPEGLTVGSQMSSVTQHLSIHPVDGTHFVVDTPGFGDTNGVEVDIANCLSISNVLRRAKTIRPIIVVAAATFLANGDGRGDAFRQFLDLLQNLFIDFDGCRFKVQFFITHGNDCSKDKCIDSLLTHVDELAGKAEEIVTHLIEDWNSDIGRVCFLQPEAHNCNSRWNSLKATEGLSASDFDFAMTVQSKDAFSTVMNEIKALSDMWLDGNFGQFAKVLTNFGQLEHFFKEGDMNLELRSARDFLVEKLKRTVDKGVKESLDTFDTLLFKMDEIDEAKLRKIHDFRLVFVSMENAGLGKFLPSTSNDLDSVLTSEIQKLADTVAPLDISNVYPVVNAVKKMQVLDDWAINTVKRPLMGQSFTKAKEIVRTSMFKHRDSVETACKKITTSEAGKEELDNVNNTHKIFSIAAVICETIECGSTDFSISSRELFLVAIKDLVKACNEGLYNRDMSAISKSFQLLQLAQSHSIIALIEEDSPLATILREDIHQAITEKCTEILSSLTDEIGISKKKDPILFVNSLRNLDIEINKSVGDKFDGALRSVWNQLQKHLEKIKEACSEDGLDIQALRKSLPKIRKALWMDPFLNNTVSSKYTKAINLLRTHASDLCVLISETWNRNPQACCEHLHSLELLKPHAQDIEGLDNMISEVKRFLSEQITRECTAYDLAHLPDILACELAVDKLSKWLDLASRVQCSSVVEKKREEIISYGHNLESTLRSEISTTDLADLYESEKLDNVLQQLTKLRNHTMFESIYAILTNKFTNLEDQIFNLLHSSEVGEAGELIAVFSHTMVLLNNDEVRKKYTTLRSAYNDSRKDIASVLRQDLQESKFELVKDGLSKVLPSDPLYQQMVTNIQAEASAQLKKISEAKSKLIGDWSYTSVNSLKNLICDFEYMYGQLLCEDGITSIDLTSRRREKIMEIDLVLTNYVTAISKQIDGFSICKMLTSLRILRHLGEFPSEYTRQACVAEKEVLEKLEKFPEAISAYTQDLLQNEDYNLVGHLLREFQKAEQEMDNPETIRIACSNFEKSVNKFFQQKCNGELTREMIEDLEEVAQSNFPSRPNLTSPIKRAKVRIQNKEQSLVTTLNNYFDSRDWKQLATSAKTADLVSQENIISKLRAHTNILVEEIQKNLTQTKNDYVFVCQAYQELQAIAGSFPELEGSLKKPLENINRLCVQALAEIQDDLANQLQTRQLTHILKSLYAADSLCSLLHGTQKKHVEEICQTANAFLERLILDFQEGIARVDCEKLLGALSTLANLPAPSSSINIQTTSSPQMAKFKALHKKIFDEDYKSQVAKLFSSALQDMIQDWDNLTDLKVAYQRFIMSQHMHYNEIRSKYLHNKGPAKEEFEHVIREKTRLAQVTVRGAFLSNLKVVDQQLRHLKIATNAGFDDAKAALKEAHSHIESAVEDQVQQSIKYSESPQSIALDLISLKEISDGAPELNALITKHLKALVSTHAKKLGTRILDLGVLLNERGRLGLEIVNSFPEFKSVVQKEFRKKTAKHGLEYCLKELRCYSDPSIWGRLKNIFTEISPDGLQYLRPGYEKYLTEWKSLVSKYAPTNDKQAIVNQVKNFVRGNKQNLREKIPSLIALILALITLEESDPEMVKVDPDTQFEPHVLQVLSILLLLGVENNKLTNQVLQISTGEGKSIILAVTAVVLALSGYQVSCVCYSQILKDRDWIKFQNLFKTLDVLSYISYDTISELCERLLREDGDPRAMTLAMAEHTVIEQVSAASRPKILLIDEIDVFFGDSFYGRTFNPVMSIPGSFELVQEAWQHYKINSLLKVKDIEGLPSWQKLVNHYHASFEPFFKKQAAEMERAIKVFKNRNYKVEGDKIGYLSHDSYNFNTVYGLETAFCYFLEHDRGNITQESLSANGYFSFPCGNYSFAEMPKKFQHVMGVTGTLEALSAPEKQIIQDYGISTIGYAPSVYGTSRLEFNKRANTKVLLDEAEYFLAITQKIQENADKKKPVLVFFKNSEVLDKYVKHQNPSQYLGDKLQMIVEGCYNQELLVKKAVMPGQVTLLTKSFGRGTDFVCLDNAVKDAHGVHVIQTFFASTCAEEIQIKGRTARQGDPGTYEIVLLYDALKKQYEITESEALDSDVYALLEKKRDVKQAKKVKARQDRVKAATALHDRSVRYMKALSSGRITEAKKLFAEFY